MGDQCSSLLAVLKEQSTVVNGLIELGLAEVDAFKQDDISGLLSIAEQQRQAVDRIRRLEQLKTGILGDIRLQLPGEEPDMGKALESITDLRSEIETEGEHLAVLAGRLQEVNETNRLLAGMSLSFTRMMQRALGMANESYDDKGSLFRPRGLPGRLDASV